MSYKGSHIVLVGFMGSGKSTIGKKLADALGLPFVDLDSKIIHQAGMSISDIFTQKGEAYFRILEKEVLDAVISSDRASVIATGGGTPCFYDNMDVILKNSYSFYLKVGRDALLDRISEDESRPLIIGKTKKELKQFIDLMLRKRASFYTKANQTVLAFGNPEKIVGRLVGYLDKIQK